MASKIGGHFAYSVDFRSRRPRSVPFSPPESQARQTNKAGDK